jgi:hypothetical protein
VLITTFKYGTVCHNGVTINSKIDECPMIVPVILRSTECLQNVINISLLFLNFSSLGYDVCLVITKSLLCCTHEHGEDGIISSRTSIQRYLREVLEQYIGHTCVTVTSCT